MEIIDARTKATTIVETLRQKGFTAYFAGGWVRDWLLNHPSDDIDIATDAPPEEVVRLFKQTVKIGISFGVIMVLIDNTPFEVATFRKDGLYLYGRRPETVAFSTPQEDAHRRDFTMNGMFFDPLSEEVLDFVSGRKDLEAGIVRAIGTPEERFKEDRLRMVRAVRMMARFGFMIEPRTRQAIEEQAHTLFPAVAKERVWQEFHKLASYPGYARGLMALYDTGLLQQIFPPLREVTRAAIENRLKTLVSPCPAILGLSLLFPDVTDQSFSSTFEQLKASKKEISLGLYFRQNRPTNDYGWVKFFADARYEQCAPHYLNSLGEEEQALHKNRRMRLKPFIQRMVEGKPLISSSYLQQMGISPGPHMGKLLAEAERLSIEAKIQDAEAIKALLQQSPYWPKHDE